MTNGLCKLCPVPGGNKTRQVFGIEKIMRFASLLFKLAKRSGKIKIKISRQVWTNGKTYDLWYFLSSRWSFKYWISLSLPVIAYSSEKEYFRYKTFDLKLCWNRTSASLDKISLRWFILVIMMLKWFLLLHSSAWVFLAPWGGAQGRNCIVACKFSSFCVLGPSHVGLRSFNLSSPSLWPVRA